MKRKPLIHRTLLFAGFLMAITGCYSLRSVETLKAERDKKLVVAVTCSDVYELSEWESLPGGDIRGSGVRKTFLVNMQRPIVDRFEGTIPCTDIRECSVEEFDVFSTTVAVAGTAVCVWGCIELVSLFSHSYWTIPSFNIGF